MRNSFGPTTCSGLILLKEGKTDEALEAIRFATRISPRNRDRHQLMGKILLARGDTEGARNAFHLSVARSPSKGSQSAAVAELFFISGRADLAEEEYNAAIEAEPDNMRFYNRRGIVLRRQRKHKEAIDNYRLAQKLSPRDSVVCYNLARAYIDLKNFDQAAIALERAIALDPEFEEAITALGAPGGTEGIRPRGFSRGFRRRAGNGQARPRAFPSPHVRHHRGADPLPLPPDRGRRQRLGPEGGGIHQAGEGLPP